MNFDYPRRAKVALGLLILLIFLSDIYFAFTRDIFDITMIPSDQVSQYQRRFESLKQALPRRGLLGYTGDTNNDLNDPPARRRYYLTQYALSPLVIANTAALPVVIGNFDDTDSAHLIFKSNGLVLIKDFGNGVQLFRRREDYKTRE